MSSSHVGDYSKKDEILVVIIKAKFFQAKII